MHCFPGAIGAFRQEKRPHARSLMQEDQFLASVQFHAPGHGGVAPGAVGEIFHGALFFGIEVVAGVDFFYGPAP